ncbi:hypothetical protein RGQ29_003765 [Quercus rubra]|uniref:BHLH domain-containing protein n=1 Tax=Quercus rubra TaxID=3512 RepID=A0AAN7ECK6_QUERU|nr:hypothetical protein RGQ29_003765 [Quercus rubra]
MSQYIVPNWNLKHQRQEQVEEEEGNRSSHVHNQQQNHPSSTSPLVPNMSSYEVAELTWENGQLAMHRLRGLIPTTPTKPTWGRAGDTLESIVHQATCHKQISNVLQHDHAPAANIVPIDAVSTGGTWADTESSGQVQVAPTMLMRKRTRSDSEQCHGRKICSSMNEDSADHTSASATFCRDNDSTMMTWASFESPRSLKTRTTEVDSSCRGGLGNRDDDEEHETNNIEMGRSHSTRKTRAAAIHNQSERRRRDKINQKMKTLQRMVPNANKTDKASMLDEVIEYLKLLQAQVQQLMSMRSMPQMMMPLGMQQHLQMSLLARMGMGVGLGMGMGMGMGMLDMTTMSHSAPQTLASLINPASVSATAPTLVSPPFVLTSMVPTDASAQPKPNSGTNAAVPLPDPYCALLAQSMNIDLYNKMAAVNQITVTTQPTSCPSQSHHVQSG